MEFIDLKKQYSLYKDEIDSAIQKVLDQGTYIMGSEIRELEHSLASYVNRNHCITVSSGTDSLMIALMALEIGPGDEVITVPFTWISSAEVIKLVGAQPVFVDIEFDTYNIDVKLVEQAITPKTKAIIAVDLFGHLADYRALDRIADLYNIPIIQDAAQSFGAIQNGKKSCSQGLISSTSFFPSKPLGCYGDGGALFTDDDALASRMRAIRTHGGEKRHYHPYLGMNARLDTLQAAILLAKLSHFDDEIMRRKKIGALYTNTLKDYFTTPVIKENNSSIYSLYTIRCQDRDQVVANLKDAGIPTAIYYPKCLHEQPVFNDLGYTLGDFPTAEQASREVLSLPMHPWLTEDEQHFICNQLIESYHIDSLTWGRR